MHNLEMANESTPAQGYGQNLFSVAVADAVRPVIQQELRAFLAPFLANQSQEDRPETWSRARACEFLGITEPTLDSLIREGRLHATRIGRRVLLDSREVRELVSSGRYVKFLERR